MSNISDLDLSSRVAIHDSDRDWLANLGCEYPDESENYAQWLGYMNLAAEVGSQRLRYETNDTDNVVAARMAFFGNIPLAMSALEKTIGTAPRLARPATFIDTQRYLYDEGFDVRRVINIFPQIVSSERDQIEDKLDFLSSLGLSTAKVMHCAPVILGQSNETIDGKFKDIAGLGVDAVKTVNSYPTILGLRLDTIRAKMEMYNSYGLDSQVIIGRGPQLLGLNPESVHEKIRLLRTLGKLMYGGDAYVEKTNRFIEVFPPVLGTKKEKIKTLGRIGINLFDQGVVKDTPYSTLSNLITTNIESVLATYLTEGGVIKTPQDLVRSARANSAKKIPKSQLHRIIASNPGDSAVQTYYEGYPPRP